MFFKKVLDVRSCRVPALTSKTVHPPAFERRLR
jgi:hypothetical protein